MSFILPFLSGFLASIIGIFPPGLINMTAAKISINNGKKRAMLFVLGALIVIVFQTYLSVLFARYINNHQEVLILLREIGLGVFTLLTIYFFFIAKKPKPKTDNEIIIKSKRSRFFMGMLISAINLFPVPYYVFISITLASYSFFSFENSSIFSLVFGVLVGSFCVFYSYVVFFERMKSKTDFFIKNMNKIIGSITGVVALFTLINIIKFYFK
jgi:threonine/homoserine/homoserine lactone efflux protein